MEKSSEVHLSDTEKAIVRGGNIPQRFIGWYTLEELQALIQ